MMSLLISAFGVTVLSASLSAQSVNDKLKQCAAIELPLARLACYDRLAKRDTTTNANLPVPQGARRVGNWYIQSELDPITDETNTTFRVFAEGARMSEAPMLGIRCIGGKLDIMLYPDVYLSDQNTGIVVRFGAEPPLREGWRASLNGTALFAPDGEGRVMELLGKFASHRRVAFQVTPYNSAPLALVFNLEGARSVVAEAKASCATGKR